MAAEALIVEDAYQKGYAAVIRGGMDVQPFAAVIPRLYEMPEK